MRRPKRVEGMEGIDFFQLAKVEAHPRVRIRLIAMGHLQAGKSQQEIAEFLGVNRSAVREWRARLERGGLNGLQEGRRSGSPPRLRREDEERFRCGLERAQQERGGGRMTGKEIAKLLKKEYGAVYSQNGVYSLLKRLGMVWISARSKHPKSDVEAQEAFKKTFPKKSKK